jgi:short subunit dehydrogenase-like uncharacterized protein
MAPESFARPNGTLRIGVLGATGVVGRRICDVLDRALQNTGVELTIIGRDGNKLRRLRGVLSSEITTVEIDWRQAQQLSLALAPLTVVINAAGPYADSGLAIARAAIAAGCHYIDASSEQTHVRQVVERLDAPARKANVAVVPACGVTSALADWATDDAMLHHGFHLPTPVLIDDITTCYIYDQWQLSAGSQRSVFASLGSPGAKWIKDRWLPARFAERSLPIDVGLGFGGQRVAVWHPSPDIILLSRRLQALTIDTYISPNRTPNVATALRAASFAMAVLPMRGLAALLGPFVADDADFSQGRFAVVTTVTTAGARSTVTISGQDIYQTTAKIAAHTGLHVALHPPSKGGVLSPAQAWPSHLALAKIVEVAMLSVDRSQ